MLFSFAIILTAIPFHMIKGNGFVVSPSDQNVEPGKTATFTCRFTGMTRPTWHKIDADGTNQVTITHGTTVNGFTYTSPSDDVAALSFTATKSLNQTMYYCTLPLIDAVNSSAAQLLVYAGPLPPSPTVTEGYISLTISWNAPWNPSTITGSPLTNYYAELYDSSNVLQEARKRAASETRRLTFHGLTSNTTYKVRMRAENTIDNSSWSDLLEETTTVSRVPDKPTNIQVSVNINGGIPSIEVTWEQDELTGTDIKGPVSSFTLYHKADDSDFSALKDLDKSTLKTNVPDPQLGVAYTVAVSATNVGGESERSDEKSVTVQFLTSATVELVNRNALNVSCNIEVTDIAVYCLVSVLSASSGETVEKSAPVTTGSSRSSVNFMVTGLSEGNQTYTVRALNGSNATLEAFSVSKLVTVAPPPIPTPTTPPTPPTPTPTTTPTTPPPNASPKEPCTPMASSDTLTIILAVIIAVLVCLLAMSTVYSILVTIKLGRGAFPKGAKTSELVYDGMEMKPPSEQNDYEMNIEKNPAYEAVNVGTTTEYEEVGGGRRE